MKWSDYGALFLAATIVSFSLTDEIRDIKLVEATIAQRGQGKPYWTSFLSTVCIFRQYVVIPALTASVPFMVVSRTAIACFVQAPRTNDATRCS
jgi:hypothetical protein